MLRTRLARFFVTVFLLGLAACGSNESPSSSADGIERIAQDYVRVVLGVGEVAPGYVDAYYGPEEWLEEVKAEPADREELLERARELRGELGKLEPADDHMAELRHEYLDKQLSALIAYLEILGGKEMRFDEEARALYDAEPPHFDNAHFEKIIAEIDKLVPGEGPLPERVEAFRKQFVIPTDRLSAVFEAALQECRARTLMHIPLPAQESFRIEYVEDKPWSGYNWYQGNAHSLIQVNTELPVYLDRAIELGCHEGYPGHHTYNALLESELVDARGWKEFTVYPLFSPQSLIAEGSANYGVMLAFPGDKQLAFERETLAPLAGIDTEALDAYAKLREQLRRLDYAGNEAARAYLNGEMSREETADWLIQYALYSPERAAQRVRFIDTYRSYVINYNLGRDLVKDYVERNADSQDKKWDAFARLLGSPRLPSGLE